MQFMRTKPEPICLGKSYKIRTSTELRVVGHDWEVAETSPSDVNRAFVEALILACGGDDDAGKAKARRLLGISRSQLAGIRVHGRLLVGHVEAMLSKTKQPTSEWLGYLSRLAAKLEGLRATMGTEEVEAVMRGQKDARKALLSGSRPLGIDVAQLPAPVLPRELPQERKRGRPRKLSASSR